MSTTSTPTEEQYTTIQHVYDFMNEALFQNELPPVLITFQQKRNSYGYFAPGRWQARHEASQTTDEIALNPQFLKQRTDKEIISTLIHEMVHVWQAYFGRPSRGGYHNREWADKMEAVGLMPSHTGQPGGNRTGQHMTHYIIAGGGFERAFHRLEADTALMLRWVAHKVKRTPPKNKVKYSCPGCRVNVWGKPGLQLGCLTCQRELAPSLR